MKNIWSKIEIHPLFYFFALMAVLTAHFQELISFMIVIFVHECGHIFMACYFKWHIKRILILPFGGMVEFCEKLNRPIYQEFLILLAGPLLQILFYRFYQTPYHYPLLFFNLLPIYPLDGSKFFFLAMNRFLSYYRSCYLLFYGSCLTIIFLFLAMPSFLSFLFLGYLFYQNVKWYLTIKSLFLKFLFERYQEDFSFYQIKNIVGKHATKMKRSVRYHFYYEGRMHTERAFLQEYFFKTGKI